MWLYLLPDADDRDNYRSLFFTGWGNDSHRTPSVWLLPKEHETTNRMTMRVSTSDQPDIGADNNVEIVDGRWTHLTFTFLNVSQSYEDYLISSAAIEIQKHTDLNNDIKRTFHERLSGRMGQMIDVNVKYFAGVFVDGREDVTLKFSANVLMNDGPLRIFRDPSFKGL